MQFLGGLYSLAFLILFAGAFNIAAACGCTQNTVLNIRRRYFKEGLEAALIHKPYNTNILTPEMAERVVALSRSAPPAGHRRWTLTLLTKAVIEQGIVESLSYPTVARTLRKYYPSPATRLPAAVPVIKKPRKKAARVPLTLKPGEQERLEEMVNEKEEPPRWAAWQTLRAEVLLHLARTPPLTKRQAADLCHCSPTLIDTVTRQYETDGLERVLTQQRGTWTGENLIDRGEFTLRNVGNSALSARQTGMEADAPSSLLHFVQFKQKNRPSRRFLPCKLP
ncbi:hypothetical protein FACS1894137_00860 [Spirochaetia bacterium]|nr:hypothetical protein FACS1894137_00860 [Spirochaetia bacterium]